MIVARLPRGALAATVWLAVEPAPSPRLTPATISVLTSGRQPACAGEAVAVRWPASEPGPNARLTPIATVVCEIPQPKPA